MFMDKLKVIFVESTTQWKLWKYIIPTDIIGIIAFLSIGEDLFGLSKLESVMWGGIIIISIWFCLFIALCLKFLIKYCHNIYVDSIWGDAIIELKNAYSEIHYLRKQEDINSEDFIGVMIIFCDTLKKIFDKKTDADCCVSIKVPISVGESLESLELQNLCRDSSHRNRDTEQYKNIKHRIIGNTAYSLIVDNILKGNQKRLAYVNNNIPNSSNYINTSIECYPDGILPYSSELVYPIVPIKGNETNQKDLKGFICIDCNKPNKFDESRYDIPMVQGVADGIYDIFANRNNG